MFISSSKKNQMSKKRKLPADVLQALANETFPPEPLLMGRAVARFVRSFDLDEHTKRQVLKHILQPLGHEKVSSIEQLLDLCMLPAGWSIPIDIEASKQHGLQLLQRAYLNKRDVYCERDDIVFFDLPITDEWRESHQSLVNLNQLRDNIRIQMLK